MIEFTILDFEEEDYGSLCALWKEAGLREISLGDIEQIVRHGGRAIVAKVRDAGDIAGSVVWTFDGHRAFVRKVAVNTKYRRCGVATALMHEAQQQITAAGITAASLLTMRENAPARALYKQLGWDARPNVEYWQTTLEGGTH